MLTLLGIHVITRRRVQKRRGKGGGQHTRHTLEKSPTSKLYTTWAHILRDRNKFAPRGEGENGEVQCPRGFSFFFWGGGGSLAPDLRFSLGRTNTFCRSSVNRSTIFSRLASIRQNLHEKRCRKLLAMQWHKTLFDESEDEDASKL